MSSKINIISDSGIDEELRRTLKLIPRSEKFTKRLLELRKRLRIPKDGFKVTNAGEGVQVAQFLKDKKIALNTAVEELLVKFPKSWREHMKDLLVFGRVLAYKPEIAIETPADEFVLKDTSPPPYVKIVLTNKMTKTHFQQWLEENWGEVEYLSEIYKLNEIKRTKRKAFDITLEAWDLEESGKSFREISDTLSEKYLENEELVSSEEALRQALSRVKKDAEDLL